MLICNSLMAQTYVAPVLGFGFSKHTGFTHEESPFGHVASSNKYQDDSFLYGLAISQKITKSGLIEFIGTHARQSAPYVDFGFVGYDGIRFNRLSFTLNAKYQIIGGLETGIGFVFKHLYSFEMGLSRNDYWYTLDKQQNTNQIGWTCSLGYEYKSFYLGVAYVYCKTPESQNPYLIKNSSSIEIMASYRFKVLNKPKMNNRQAENP